MLYLEGLLRLWTQNFFLRRKRNFLIVATYDSNQSLLSPIFVSPILFVTKKREKGIVFGF